MLRGIQIMAAICTWEHTLPPRRHIIAPTQRRHLVPNGCRDECVICELHRAGIMLWKALPLQEAHESEIFGSGFCWHEITLLLLCAAINGHELCWSIWGVHDGVLLGCKSLDHTDWITACAGQQLICH